MSQYYDKSIVCPFYVCERKLTGVNCYKIACEPIKLTKDLQISFATSEKRNAYKARYCRNLKNYKNCPIAEMLFDKYICEE